MIHEVGDRVIVRTYSAGAFLGTIQELDWGRRIAAITSARRLWSWDGAASLSELATRGTSKPGGCKFPAAVPAIEVGEVIEVLAVTPEAAASIDAVPVWSNFGSGDGSGDGFGDGFGDGSGFGFGSGSGSGSGSGFGSG